MYNQIAQGLTICIIGAGALLTGSAILTNSQSSYDFSNDYNDKIYLTYTLINDEGKIYAGRTSGYGVPETIMRERYSSHHMRLFGYGNPKLDVWTSGPNAYNAIRGREQNIFDFYGGLDGGILGNKINPISPFNINKPIYMESSKESFPDFKGR